MFRFKYCTRKILAIAFIVGVCGILVAWWVNLSTQQNVIKVSAKIENEALMSVPPQFLGFSFEWHHIGTNTLGSTNVLVLLQKLASYRAGKMILRIGGHSADTVKKRDPEIYDILRKVQNTLPVQYIIGLNLYADDPELTKRQYQEALVNLPGQIATFELGNEPNYYDSFYGKKNGVEFLSNFPTKIKNLAAYLAKNSDKSLGLSQFAGPVWGHVFMSQKYFGWFLEKCHKYLNLVTIHYYKEDARKVDDGPNTLLDEKSLQKEMKSLRELVEESGGYNLKLRVDESNSISGGGLDGVSNVFASALWALDASFEMVKNGAIGVNYHQGSGYYAFFKEMSENSILVQPCFYGYLMFQQAVQGKSVLLQQKQKMFASSKYVKIWPVKEGDNMRIVLINKNGQKNAIVVLKLKTKNNKADLIRLLAPSLVAKSGITLAGISYEGLNGATSGIYTSEKLIGMVGNSKDDEVSYQVQLPPGSAAMLVTSLH